MADEVTAVAELVGTVPEEPVATEEATPPDSAQLEGADSDTDEGLTDPEEVDPLDALDEDALTHHPKVETLLKHTEATARESERQLTERRLNGDFAGWLQSEQQRVRTGATFNKFVAITAAVAASDDGKITGQQADELAQLAQSVAASAFVEQWAGFSKGFRDRITREYPDYRMPRSVSDKLDAAQNSFRPEIAVEALFEAARTAALESETPKLKKQVTAELKQAQKTSQIKQASATERAGPTAVGGSGIPGGLTNKQLAELPTNVWNSYSQEQRDQILNNPKRWAS